MEQISVAFVYENESTKDILDRLIGEDENLCFAGKAKTEKQMLDIIRNVKPDIFLFPSLAGKMGENKGRKQPEATVGAARCRLPGGEIDISDPELEIYVTRFLLELGMPANIKGYHFIRDAILLALADKRMMGSVTKNMYPAIARRYQTTPSKVERAIRHAIEVAWSRGRAELICDYFSYAVSHGKGKPTNSEFISLVSDKIRLDLKEKAKSKNGGNTQK